MKETAGLKSGGGGGSFDDMDARLKRLEDAFLGFDAKLDRMSGDLGEVKVSQARIQERMERIMDRTGNMPTEATISKVMNQKLTTLSVVFAVVVGIATLIITN